MACSSGESSATRLAGRNRKTIAFPYDRSTWSTPPQSRWGRVAAKGESMHRSWLARRSLGASTASHGQVAHLVKEHRALQGIHLCDVRSQLRQKRVAENRRRLFMATATRIPKQMTDVDFQCSGETCQRRQRRHRLAVLDFRDVGARHLHTPSQLTLTQIAALAQITHRARDLQAVIFCHSLFRFARELRNEPFWFLDLEGLVAASAKRVCGAELHQSAAFTPKNLTCLNGY